MCNRAGAAAWQGGLAAEAASVAGGTRTSGRQRRNVGSIALCGLPGASIPAISEDGYVCLAFVCQGRKGRKSAVNEGRVREQAVEAGAISARRRCSNPFRAPRIAACQRALTLPQSLINKTQYKSNALVALHRPPAADRASHK
jgi:hypothetical protein